MRTQSLVLGGDLGGTSTRVLVVGTDGRVRGRSTAAAGNPVSHPDGAAAAFGEALRAAQAGVDPDRVEASVSGVAGVSALRTPPVAARFGQVWADPGAYDPKQGSLRSWIAALTHRRSTPATLALGALCANGLRPIHLGGSA